MLALACNCGLVVCVGDELNPGLFSSMLIMIVMSTLKGAIQDFYNLLTVS